MNNVSEVRQVVGGRFLDPQKIQAEFAAVTTDTRATIEGTLFVALRGERFDAHDFLPQALAKRPAALVVDRIDWFETNSADIPVLVVEDTLIAFQHWATHVRRQSRSIFFGVTGSNGKTTTKRFLQILLGDESFCSHGSFNNHWGVPMTLLEADDRYKYVVVEMGMNHAGEIDRLAAMVEPDFSCVTTVSGAHREFFRSVEEIARAKAEIYSHTKNGIAFNLDNEFTRKHFESVSAKIKTTFSLEEESADVYLQCLSEGVEGVRVRGHIGALKGEQVLPVLGSHNVANLAAACSLALMAGVDPSDLWPRIPLCRTEWGRNMLIGLKGRARILFDAYNANPQSMLAFLQTVGKLNDRDLVLILGTMKELGEDTQLAHAQIAENAAALRPVLTVFVGDMAEQMRESYEKSGGGECLVAKQSDPQLIVSHLSNPVALIAAKGSRAVKLENFFPQIPEITSK